MSRAGPIAIAVFAVVFAARAQERGRLLEVRTGGDAQAASVELIGDRPLSFTTMKLAGPPRIVVDLADTDVAAPERDVLVEDGTLRRVAAAPAGTKTARVVIELAAESEFDVRAVGNRVEVRVPRLAPMVAQTQEPPPEQQPAAPAQPETEAQKRASLPKVALVGSRPAQAQPPAAEAKKRAAAEEPALPATGGARMRGASEEKRIAAAEAKGMTDQERQARAERAAAARKAAQQAAADKAAAQKAARAQARARPPERKVAIAERARHNITGIGFRPTNGGEVIVRSDHPLEYGVTGEDNAVLLHLPDAGIPLPNNRRPLDTEFFGGPVQRIVPVAVAGGTDVRIELKGRTDYSLQQSGSVLTVTFSRPQ